LNAIIWSRYFDNILSYVIRRIVLAIGQSIVNSCTLLSYGDCKLTVFKEFNISNFKIACMRDLVNVCVVNDHKWVTVNKNITSGARERTCQ